MGGGWADPVQASETLHPQTLLQWATLRAGLPGAQALPERGLQVARCPGLLPEAVLQSRRGGGVSP